MRFAGWRGQDWTERAHKPDSQEIWFIPDHDYAKFIEENTDCRLPEGNFVDKDGRVLAISHYALYGRTEEGTELALGRPVSVTGTRPDTNEVVIGRQ